MDTTEFIPLPWLSINCSIKCEFRLILVYMIYSALVAGWNLQHSCLTGYLVLADVACPTLFCAAHYLSSKSKNIWFRFLWVSVVNLRFHKMWQFFRSQKVPGKPVALISPPNVFFSPAWSGIRTTFLFINCYYNTIISLLIFYSCICVSCFDSAWQLVGSSLCGNRQQHCECYTFAQKAHRTAVFNAATTSSKPVCWRFRFFLWVAVILLQVIKVGRHPFFIGNHTIIEAWRFHKIPMCNLPLFMKPHS